MKKINIETWKRKTTYDNFIKYTNPVFSVGTRLDVTELLDFCRKNEKKFFATFLYFVTRCVNEVEEMRTRINGEDVVIYKRVRPSYIVALENEELVTCISDIKNDFEEFHDCVNRDIASSIQKNIPVFDAEIFLDCIYVSCLPWLDFTSVINPYNFEDKSASSIPRITWGKYVKNDIGRYEMAMDIAAHHALIDGRQVARVYEKIQNAINQPEQFLRRNTNEG